MTDLPPCPFCGKQPVEISRSTYSCDGMVDGREVHNTIVMRREAWNARAEAYEATRTPVAADWHAAAEMLDTCIEDIDRDSPRKWVGEALSAAHCGDCTGECQTCERCLAEKYVEDAKRIVEAAGRTTRTPPDDVVEALNQFETLIQRASVADAVANEAARKEAHRRVYDARKALLSALQASDNRLVDALRKSTGILDALTETLELRGLKETATFIKGLVSDNRAALKDIGR